MIKTYLGFDVGTKRTGIAIANSLTNQAIGIDVVTHHKNWLNQLGLGSTKLSMHTVSIYL